MAHQQKNRGGLQSHPTKAGRKKEKGEGEDLEICPLRMPVKEEDICCQEVMVASCQQKQTDLAKKE